MTKLVEWPERPEHMGLANSAYWEAYERQRADAAMARLRVAVAELEQVYGWFALSQIDLGKSAEIAHERIFKVLELIGDLPPQSGEGG